MTWRRGKWFLIGVSVLYVGVIAAAVYLTWNNRTKPSPFVDPVIWRDPHNSTPPDRQFDI